MRWWTKCVSMVIAKTASRNIAAKAGKMSEAVLDLRKRALLRPKQKDRRQEASSEQESLDDDGVERNADLYIFNHEVAQR